ncbi:hypothetical protein V8C42DRAFT_305521 [Trichoderma barbatum]
MADVSSASNIRGLTQEQLANSTPPSTSSSSSSCAFQDTPSEVPPEYLMASPSPLPPYAGQGFPFPPQQPASFLANPLSGFIHSQARYKQYLQDNYNSQTSHTDKVASASSFNLPELEQHSSSARLIHEQRLSTCLNILRHIQRTLRKCHDEATLRLSYISHSVVQTTWDLFFQSPLDFMCHEMDILTDAATSAILSEGGLSQRHSVCESEAWMRKLDGLRDLRDDENDAKERVRKTLRRMQCADAIMRVGLREQTAALRGDPTAGQYRRAFDHVHRDAEAVAPPNGAASATLSSFFNWPLPAMALNDDEASMNTDDNTSDTASGSSGQCDEECCRHQNL